MLNRSIILKHRLRPHEYQNFPSPRPTVTKVLIPIDGTDLRSGAHSFFIGQAGFEAMAEQAFGNDLRPGSRDRQLLDLIDNLPSLDPFGAAGGFDHLAQVFLHFGARLSGRGVCDRGRSAE